MTQYQQRLVDLGLGEDVELALVDFSGTVRSNDMNPVEPGKQYFAKANADVNENGIPDFVEAIRLLKTPYWDGTSYDAALQETISVIQSKGEPDRDTMVVFITDGEVTVGGSGASYAQQLRNMGAYITAYGIGSDGDFSVAGLQAIDPNCVWFDDMNELYDVFSGLNGAVVQFDEQGLPGWDVYLDVNNNGFWDSDEPHASAVNFYIRPTVTDRGRNTT